MEDKRSKLYSQFTRTRKYYKDKDIKMFNDSMLTCVKQMKAINFQNILLLNFMKIKFSLLFKDKVVKNINHNIRFVMNENKLLDKIKSYIEGISNKKDDASIKTYNILIDIYELHTIRKDNINKLINDLKYEHDDLFDEKIKIFTKRIENL